MFSENNGSNGRRHVEFFVGLCFDGESYKFHRWFHMIYIIIIIMQFRGASFILLMKSRDYCVVGMIMVSICLHGVISWSHASSRGRFGQKKPVIAEKYHPSVSKFCLTWTVYNISNIMELPNKGSDTILTNMNLTILYVYSHVSNRRVDQNIRSGWHISSKWC